MTWIAVTLEDDEELALREPAKREKQELYKQAALLNRKQLKQLKLINPGVISTTEVENE